MSVDPKVIEKLRKVLNLAARGATQGEMEAAMARAKEIALQHQIDLASISVDDGTGKAARANTVETNKSEVQIGRAFWRKFHPWVVTVLQQCFDVHVITSRYRDGSRERVHKMWFIGEVTDVEMAKLIFPWLEDLFPKSYLDSCRRFSLPENAATQHGYFRGLAAGILEANKREEKKAEAQVGAQQWAVMVINKKDAVQRRVEQEFPDLKSKVHRAVNVSQTAAAVGFQRGKSVNLNQVGGGNPNNAINQ